MTLASPTSPAPVAWVTWVRRQLDSLAPAALALALALVTFLLGWRGVDQAAQTYRTVQFNLHGLMLWDSGWYAGNFPLGYSVLFPVVAGLLGLHVVAAASAVVSTWSFDRVIRNYFGARPLGTWYFAVSTLLPVTIGQWPFLAGEAAGMLALVFLQKGRKPPAILLGLLSALFSPLAAAFLAMGCLAWAAYSIRRRWMIATAATAMVVVLALGALFPGTGPFPFPWTGLVPTELLCLTALTPLVRTTPAVRLGAVLYAAASLFSFLVPNPLGGNAPRLAESVGVPLLACFLTAPGPALTRLSHSQLVGRLGRRGRRLVLPDQWRYSTALILVPFAVWQWAPWAGVITSPASAPWAGAAYYAPVIDELRSFSPDPVRVEIPPTLDHWESAAVAPYVSLARGWERQLDIADNPLFYTPGLLTPASYSQWLISEGVGYVALASAPLDYAGKAEGALLSSGTIPGLTRVWGNHDWTLWKVNGSPGLISGPGRLTGLEPDHLTIVAQSAGTITVRVRYTRYWAVSRGAACVSPGPGTQPAAATGTAASAYQWTTVTALQPGLIELSASVIHEQPTPGCPSN
jgi:hypothetical protein